MPGLVLRARFHRFTNINQNGSHLTLAKKCKRKREESRHVFFGFGVDFRTDKIFKGRLRKQIELTRIIIDW